MRYQNELLQSATPFENEKSNNTKHLFIAFTCALVVTASYAFFSANTQTSTPESIALTIPDITTTIEDTEKSDSLITEVDRSEIEQSTPGTTRPPIQNMQSLSTIWQEHKIKSGESLSAIFSENNLTKLDFYKIIHANDISSQFAEIRFGNTLLIGRDISGKLSHLVYKKKPVRRIESNSY